MGTTKILYMRDLRLFAMYVCTKSVRTYIAKNLKHVIYAILYGTKVAVDTLSTTTQVESSCRFDNLISSVTRSNPLYKSVGHFDQLMIEDVSGLRLYVPITQGRTGQNVRCNRI